MSRIAEKPEDFSGYHKGDQAAFLVHEVVSDLIRKHGGRIYRFSELPTLEAKLAIAQYMGINGEAWDLRRFWEPIEFEELSQRDKKARFAAMGRNAAKTVQALTDAIPEIEKAKPKTEIGYVVVPIEELKAACMKCGDLRDDWDGDFDAYHRWYAEGLADWYVEKATWPSIFSSFDHELFEDGWHRFHRYVQQGATEVPVLWYPENGEFEHD